MRLALNMAKMAKERISRAPLEKTKYLINKLRAEVREENIWGVEFPWHNKVKGAMKRHPEMLSQNQTSACLSGQKWNCKQSTDMLGTQRNRYTSIHPTQSADSRADSTSALHATHPTSSIR
jgi:hypothetical protein